MGDCGAEGRMGITKLMKHLHKKKFMVKRWGGCRTQKQWETKENRGNENVKRNRSSRAKAASSRACMHVRDSRLLSQQPQPAETNHELIRNWV